MSESDQELVDAMMEEDSKECSISDPLITMQSASSQNNSSIVREDALLLLKKFFGHDSFRPLQWTIIKNALDGIDQVVVMSTGFGKSVCYQLPSLYTKKLTIVISPLISLMNDQVENVRCNGVEAACISSENNSDEQHSILESSSLRLLYITPEFALHNSSLLKSIRKNVCLLAVDEAHCVSQWGHEFRPNYRRLAEVRRIFNGKVPVMALTATATQQVKMDIVKNLELHQPVITCASLDRPNLYLSVRSPASLKELLNLLTNEDEKNGKHFNGSTIIYCSTRTLVNEIYDTLSKTGVKCARYHAGMSVVARRKAHENFVKDRITTMVATVAFGMGIDKPDVRNVIHYGAPKNIESYYQEIGRAGRDGCPSMCIVLYKDHDLVKHRHSILRDKSLKEEYKKHLTEMLSMMEQFLHTVNCRRSLLLSHFGESVKNSYPRARCCDVCDKLINLENSGNGHPLIRSANYGDDALLLLRAVEVFQGYTGLGKIIDFLKGKANVIKTKQRSQFYGLGKHKTEAFWKELGRVLRMSGYIMEKKSSYNDFAHVISLAEKGQKWLQGNNRELYLDSTPVLIGRTRNNDNRCISLPKNSEPLHSRQYFFALYDLILNFKKQHVWKECSCYKDLMRLNDSTASEQLEKILFETRTNLAIEHDCGAHMIASNTCIQQLSIKRPSTVEKLCNIKEMTEEKQRKYGRKFVDVIADFCCKHDLSVDCSIDLSLPEEIVDKMSALNEAHKIVFQNHVKGRTSLSDAAEQRGVSEGTITSYFVNFVKNGLPIHLDAIDINKQHLDTVFSAIREYGSDILRLKPIMEKLPENFIDYNRLKIIFGILEYEYGVTENSERSSCTSTSSEIAVKRNIPEWMKTHVAHSVEAKKSKKSNLFK